MATELRVDGAGLRVAASASEAATTALTTTNVAGSRNTQPSGAGVAAVDAALASVSQRQALRVASQADHLADAATRYDSTDGDSGAAIAAVSV